MNMNETIAEGRRLDAAATPGPWEVRPSGGGFKIGDSQQYDAVAGNYEYEEGGVIEENDADLIVWARNNLPALLDTLDRVREEADDLAHSDDGKHSYEFGLSEAGKRILAVLDGGQ
ncbi:MULTISPECIES: hypothetical protein [Rhodococcus]|uniref:hypothetical protein n=1 Tax=Rhodococcus TaxID=1827 RepID=UPI0011AB7950|nr:MULTISPECIES: hypothetical protein [Rhodococcus]